VRGCRRTRAIPRMGYSASLDSLLHASLLQQCSWNS
jgi:hypothetical protein